MTKASIQCAARQLQFDTPVVMGILNVTPDSFSDGGLFSSTDKALRQAEKMLGDGAQIIDVGGESTRPGAQSVSSSEELDRVIPIIERIHQELDVIISIDTSKAIIMTEAARAGAGMINDIMALRADGALVAAQKSGLPICLMHMQGEPRIMQSNPQYNNVVAEVKSFLTQRVEECLAAGIKKQQILLDPGFGFGKTLLHNIELFKQLKQFIDLQYPVLIGVSRKNMIGQITARDTEQRLAGSVALAALAAAKGVAVLRVHDVAETLDAVKIAKALA